MNRKGISLIEIVVSTILLILIIAGLMGIFIVVKRRVQITKGRISGGELGKLFIDPLHEYVRRNDWDTAANALCWGAASPCIGTWDAGNAATVSFCDSVAAGPAHQYNPFCTNMGMASAANSANRTIDGIEYSAEYRITLPFPNVRRVVTRITWQTPE